MSRTITIVGLLLAAFTLSGTAQAGIISFSACSGATNGCNVTNTPPNPVAANPNDDQVLAWHEVQDFTLVNDLEVNVVFDPLAPFFTAVNANRYDIAAGTVVSSHMIQWDSASTATVEFSLSFDAPVIALVVLNRQLNRSDYLGEMGNGMVYPNFSLRGLESNDTGSISGNTVSGTLLANSPGDWVRVITARVAAEVPVPATIWLFMSALMVMVGVHRRA
jgi:hypothetical protein